MLDRELSATLGAAGAVQVEMRFAFDTYIDRLVELLLPHSMSPPTLCKTGVEVTS
jgi:hypothetical protein